MSGITSLDWTVPASAQTLQPAIDQAVAADDSDKRFARGFVNGVVLVLPVWAFLGWLAVRYIF